MPAIESRATELYGRGTSLFIISILFSFAAFVLVISRLMSRLTTTRRLGTDDYVIVLSMVSMIDQIDPMTQRRCRPTVLISTLGLLDRAHHLQLHQYVWAESTGLSSVLFPHSRRADIDVGVEHGAGKAMNTLDPGDIRMALQVSSTSSREQNTTDISCRHSGLPR